MYIINFNFVNFIKEFWLSYDSHRAKSYMGILVRI